jgi:molybdopterin molybdotransferase
MIDYQEARNRILAAARFLGAESVPLLGALGRSLAVDVKAGEDIPPFAKAVMDGYAVRAADTRLPGGGGAVELEVVEDLPAGRVARKAVGPGQAIRIMTGAPLPRGADAVVMVERTEKAGTAVRVLHSVRPGENIGLAGEDVRKGDVVLEKGSLVGPAELGMLAALNRSVVRVARRPRAAVVATGDEVVEPGERKGPGKIRNSNGYSLLAMAQGAGAEASYLGIARDRKSSLVGKIRRAAECDILLLSGGVSVGDHDLVKSQLESLGVRPVFWKVRIKPGKPVFFGVRGKQLVFGLPGNPTSAMVTFLLFVRPAIDKMTGKREIGPRRAKAILSEDIALKPGRRHYLRGILEGAGPVLRVAPYANQKSGVLRSMVRSRVLIEAPADASRLEKDREVDIVFIE